MTLPLLKNLRITARRLRPTINPERRPDSQSDIHHSLTRWLGVTLPTCFSWVLLMTATTTTQAQQFEAPRQHPDNQHLARLDRPTPTPARTSTPARTARPPRQRPATYAPPVHIAPLRGVVDPLKKPATASVTLSDRLPTPRLATRRPDTFHASTKHVPAYHHKSQQAVWETRGPVGSGLKSRRSATIRQTAARQEEFEAPLDTRRLEQRIEQQLDTEPFVDLQEPEPFQPVKVARQSSGFRTPSHSYPERKTLGQPVSILTGSSRQQEDTARPESPPSLSIPNAFGPATEELPAPDSTVQDDSQRMEQRLDELMEETENQLRTDDLDFGDDSRFADDTTKSLLDDDDDSDEGSDSTLLDKTCQEFRYQLLDNPIRNIALDMSPLPSDLGFGRGGVSRSWTDRSGNVIANGTMVDWRRSYIVLDTGQRIAFARLSEADMAAVADYWRTPASCSVGNRGSVCRNWCPQTFTWTAASLCHKPLYFENIQLERYGHSHGPFTQPIRSVAHFFVSLVTVPYQQGMHPPNECQYALGFYRPGDCAPWLKDPIPISLNGARRQALVTTGLAVIP